MPEICFSYSPDVPSGIRDRTAAQRAARDLRRMPTICFSYSPDASLEIRDRTAVQRAACDLRRMPTGPCFRY